MNTLILNNIYYSSVLDVFCYVSMIVVNSTTIMVHIEHGNPLRASVPISHMWVLWTSLYDRIGVLSKPSVNICIPANFETVRNDIIILQHIDRGAKVGQIQGGLQRAIQDSTKGGLQ